MINSSLQKATDEQKMADENVLKLLEEQKVFSVDYVYSSIILKACI